MALHPSVSLPKSTDQGRYGHYGFFSLFSEIFFTISELVCRERRDLFLQTNAVVGFRDTRYKYNWLDNPVSETPALDNFEMALVHDHKQQNSPHWRQAQYFRWFFLKFLMFPEQVNAQSELLERRTKVGIVVPALLHDLVYLKETNANFVLTNKKKGSELKCSFPN